MEITFFSAEGQSINTGIVGLEKDMYNLDLSGYIRTVFSILRRNQRDSGGLEGHDIAHLIPYCSRDQNIQNRSLEAKTSRARSYTVNSLILPDRSLADSCLQSELWMFEKNKPRNIGRSSERQAMNNHLGKSHSHL